MRGILRSPGLYGLVGWLMCGVAAGATLGSMPFIDHRDPPAYLPLTGPEADNYALGHAVFNSAFLAAGTAGAARLAGLGPMFNAPSCDECHNEGAHGRGPAIEGPVPDALVVQLEAPSASVSTALRDAADPAGDPVYGRILSSAAVEGFMPEGQAIIRYHVIQRTYPDGVVWTLRQPEYELTQLHYGPLAINTVIKPRMATALFGLGLLEAVPGQPAGAGPGRFGWQGAVATLRDQTTRALARDMGVTSSDRPVDDCTEAETECLTQRHPATPEISEELLTALLTFEKWLSVPRNPVPPDQAQQAAGFKLFKSIGCSGCHRPEQPVVLSKLDGPPLRATIAPYTDLRIHDLGAALADRDLSGAVHPTRWRTAPLWGMGYRLSRERRPTFLHDGRARSVEEAVLWHDGEAASVREAFERLSRAHRKELLRFVGAL